MTLQFTPRRSRHTPRFPNAIRAYRVAKGMSQAALAASLGLHRSLVSRWEHGLRLPSVPRLLQVARVLGATPELLFRDCVRDDSRAEVANPSIA